MSERRGVPTDVLGTVLAAERGIVVQLREGKAGAELIEPETLVRVVRRTLVGVMNFSAQVQVGLPVLLGEVDPEIDVPVDRVAGLARDAAYAGVGAVVITAQKATERRRELTDQVTSQVRRLVDSVA